MLRSLDQGHSNAVIWCDPGYAPLAEAVVALMGHAVSVTAVGGPASQGVDALARSLGVEATDDPRQLLLDASADSVLLLTCDPPLERELLASVCEQAALLTLEPLAADVRRAAELGLGGEPGEKKHVAGERVISVPQFTESPGYRRATDAEQAIGVARGLSIESIGRAGRGSLFARLYDAWVTVLGFVDLPLSIDASLAGAVDPRDELRRVAGTLSAHARTAEEATVTLIASDRGGHDARRLEALGDAAHLTVNDASYTLLDLEGEPIDRHEGDGQPTTVADLVADQWRRTLERGGAGPTAVPPPRRVSALACCEACLLSARTGQPESPRRVLEMAW